MRITISISLISAAMLLSASVRAEDQVVMVKFQDGKVSLDPVKPRVNTFSSDSVAIELDPPDARWRAMVTIGEEALTQELVGSRIVITLKRSGKKSKLTRVSDNSVVVETEDAGVMVVTVWRDCTGDATCKTPGPFGIPIRIERRPWLLQWSAGIAVMPDFGFDRYAIKSEGTPPASILTALDPENPKVAYEYRISAFAHYLPASCDWFAISGGAATNVPVSDLSALLGISLRARTFDVLNDGFLTIGVAFTPLRRLASGLQTGKTVPSEVTNLYEKHYGLTPFVAMTFAFLGGESGLKASFGAK